MKGYHEGRKRNKFFMGLISVLLCATIVAMSSVTAFAATPVDSDAVNAPEKLVFSTVDSIAEQRICLIVFGDMTQNGADSEGRAIIGGDLSVTGNWSASIKEKMPGEYVLLLGGNMLSGNVDAGGSVAQTNGKSFNQVATSNGSLGVSNDTIFMDNSGWIKDYVTKAEAAFIASSASYAKLPADGTAEKNQWNSSETTLKPSSNHKSGEPHVFYINDDMSLLSVIFDGTFGNDSIIVNVSGKVRNMSNYGGAQGRGDMTIEKIQNNVIWNFYEATEINTSGFSIQGSLLAPYATYTGSGGHVNGTTVVKNMVGNGGFEYHTGHFFKNPFSADLTVSKAVVGETEVDETFDFELLKDGTVVKEFSLKHGESFRYSDLAENGKYVVREKASSDNFTFGKVEVTGDGAVSGNTATFTATDGTSRTIVFYNNAVEKAKEEYTSVKVTKKVVDSEYDGRAFDFELWQYAPDGTAAKIDTFSLKNGETYTKTDLINTITKGSDVSQYKYEVKEMDYSSLYTTANGVKAAASTGTVVLDGGEIVFTNTRKTGTLTLSKAVEGTTAADSFTFRLYKKSGEKWTAVGEDFTLQAGKSVALPGLVYGVEYAVAEIDAGNYNYKGVTGADMIQIDGKYAANFICAGDISVKFTNELKVGGLTVTKEVTGGNAEDEFTFTIEKKNGSTWTKVETFKLKAGASKTFTGLVSGDEYRVTETAMGSIYTLDSITGADSVDGSAAQVKIVEGKSATLNFKNKVKLGKITISKSLTDNSATEAASFKFRVEVLQNNVWAQYGEVVTLSAENGKTATAVVENLLFGETYRVVEVDADDYNTSVTPADKADSKTSAAITIDGDETVEFANTKQTLLTVQKSLAAGSDDIGRTFTMILQKKSGNDYVNVETFTLKAGEVKTFAVPADYYRVIEAQNVVEYDFSKFSVANGATAASASSAAISGVNYTGVAFRLSGNGSVTIENKIKLGSINVSKVLNDSILPASKFEFQLQKKVDGEWKNISGAKLSLGHGEAAAFTNLPYGGSYRVVEAVSGNVYSSTVKVGDGASTVSGSTSPEILVDEAETAVVFNNTRKTANLTLTKALQTGSNDLGEEFEITVSYNKGGKWTPIDVATFGRSGVVTLKAGDSVTMNLPVDVSYKIEETKTGASYQLVGISGVNTSNIISLMGESEVVVTNAIKSGSLKIVKELKDNSDPDATFSFIVYEKNVTTGELTQVASKEMGAGEWTLTGLPYGNTYVVKETVNGNNYKTEVSINGSAAAITTEGETLITSGTPTVEFTNTRKQADIVVTKKISAGSNLIEGETFSFEVYKKVGTQWTKIENSAFTLEANQSKTLTYDVGYEYCVVETASGSSYVFDSDDTSANYAFVGTNKGIAVALGDKGANINIYNKNKTQEIVVRKSVVGGTVNTTDKFTFELYQKVGTAYQKIAEQSTVGGGYVTFNSSNVDAAYPLYLGNEYKIVETNIGERYELKSVDGADSADVSKAEALLTLKGAADVLFTNTVKQGQIKVTKTLADAFDADAQFAFSAEKFEGGKWVSVGTKTLGDKGEWIITGIPYGTTVRITEAVNGNIYSTKIGTAEGASKEVVVNSASTAVAFTNTRKTASITVNKALEDGGENLGKEFSFKLEVNKGGIWTAVETFKLKAGASKTIEGLFVGADYRVIETDTTDSFNFAGVTGGSPITVADGQGAELTLAKDTAITVENKLKKTSLTITKTVVGEANGDTFTFDIYKYAGGKYGKVDSVSLTKANGYSYTLENVAVGDKYKVVETNIGSRYSLTDIIGADTKDVASASAEVTITPDGQTVGFTNTVKLGKITVKKALVDAVNPNASFSFVLEKKDGTAWTVVAPFELADKETKEFADLSYGDVYRVRELATGNVYTTSVSTGSGTSAEITVASANAEVVFTNTRNKATLTVDKTLANGTSDEKFSFALYRVAGTEKVLIEEFELSAADEAKTFQLETNESYVIAEKAASASSYEFDTAKVNNVQNSGQYVDGANAVSVSLTGDTNVEFINKLKKADLTISKFVNGKSTDEAFNFVVYKKNAAGTWDEFKTLSIKAGSPVTLTNLTFGDEYKIAEIQDNPNYQFSGMAGVDSANLKTIEATVVINGARDVSFTNTIKEGSISVTKKLVDTTDADSAFSFKVFRGDTQIGSFTLKNGQTETISSGTKYGTIYHNDIITIVEDEDAKYNTSITVNGKAAASAEIKVGDSTAVEFTNTRKTNELVVTKALATGSADLGEKFDMLLEKKVAGEWVEVEKFTLGNKQSATFTVDYKADYRITEAKTGESYSFDSIKYGSQVSNANPTVVTIDGDLNVSVVNKIKTGEVNIVKTLEDGYRGDGLFTFYVSVDGAEAVPYTIAGAGTVSVKNVPYGSKVTVTEAVSPDYNTFVTVGEKETAGRTAEFTLTSASATIGFRNVRKTGSIEVTKQLAKGDKDTGESFTFNLSMMQTDGTWSSPIKTVALKAGQKEVFTDLYANVQYKVTEVSSGESYTFQSVTGGSAAEGNSAIVEVTEGTSALTFTNRIKRAGFSVQKIVENAQAAYADDYFTFELIKDGKIIETFTMKAGDVKSFANLQLGDVYQIREVTDGMDSKYAFSKIVGADSADGSTATVTVTEEDKAIQIVNTLKLGKISVTKELVDAVEPDAKFTFSLYQVTEGGNVKIGNTFELANGETWQSGDLPYGGVYYVVEENSGEKYTTTATAGGKTVTAAKSANITIGGELTEVMFKNVRNAVDFKIKKTVSGVTEQDEEFTILVTGIFDTGFATKTFVFNRTGKGDDESVTYALLADEVSVPGALLGAEYTVEEIGAEYYSCQINGVTQNSAVVVAKAGTVGDVSNVRKTADVTVKKIIADGKNLGETFKFALYAEIDGKWALQTTFSLKADEQKTIADLPVGLKYKVIETDTGKSYLFGGVGAGVELISNETEQGALFALNSDKDVVISNNIKTDSITVRKAIAAEGGDPSARFTFELFAKNGGVWTSVQKFTLAANESKKIDNLKIGESYKIVETETGVAYAFDKVTIANKGAADEIIENGAVITVDGAEDVTFTNKPTEAKLIVEKKLAKNSVDLGDKFDFDLLKNVGGAWVKAESFKLAANETKTINAVYGVQYKVIEVNSGANYTLASVSGADKNDLTAREATVKVDGDERITFTNKVNTGAISVQKIVSGLVSGREVFTFKVTDETGRALKNAALNSVGEFQLTAGKSMVLDNIPYGTKVVITEIVDEEEFTTSYTIDGDSPVYNGAETTPIKVAKEVTAVKFINDIVEISDVLSEIIKKGSINNKKTTVITEEPPKTPVADTPINNPIDNPISDVLGADDVISDGTVVSPVVTNVLGDTDTVAPSTGDEFPTVIIIMMVVSGLAVLLISKKRKSFAHTVGD
jgi:choice-of-anchor A domain-containing protein